MGAGVILEVCALETVLWSETEGKEETRGWGRGNTRLRATGCYFRNYRMS